MTTIPATYESSRERFRASLASFSNPSTRSGRRHWPDSVLTSIPLADESDLTIDIISAPATRDKQKLLILTTGLHGIEGYVGSGILQLFIQEYLSKFDSETTGIILVHPINPYGMKDRIRTNKNSVDLNRNFVEDFEELKSINPHYESLAYLLNPARPLQSPFHEKLTFLWNVLRALPKGAQHIREAALMGQYRIHNGMYFGGFEIQEETKFMMDLFSQSISEYAKVVILDIHTGYGPRWQMTLLNPPAEKMTAKETASRFKVPLVAGVNPEEFYSIHGDMTDYVHRMLGAKYPDKDFYVGTFEFGTYGDSLWQGIHSLRTTALEHCLRWFGGSDSSRAWMKRECDELFMPSDPTWWEKAKADARAAFDGIFNAYGIIY
ncbi:MAG: DUF2817 domain-containing protein [Chloroflexi bacterium]|nr:DUF2817 domain-containing protein [Chloroflexota bacterium]